MRCTNGPHASGPPRRVAPLGRFRHGASADGSIDKLQFNSIRIATYHRDSYSRVVNPASDVVSDKFAL